MVEKEFSIESQISLATTSPFSNFPGKNISDIFQLFLVLEN